MPLLHFICLLHQNTLILAKQWMLSFALSILSSSSSNVLTCKKNLPYVPIYSHIIECQCISNTSVWFLYLYLCLIHNSSILLTAAYGLLFDCRIDVWEAVNNGCPVSLYCIVVCMNHSLKGGKCHVSSSHNHNQDRQGEQEQNNKNSGDGGKYHGLIQ